MLIDDIKHKNNRKQAWSRIHTSNKMAFILYLLPVPATQFSILTAISKPCPPLTAVCEETSTAPPRFFWVIAKNSLINYVFEEETILIVKHDFFWKIVPYWVHLAQGEDFKLTTELYENVQYPHNQSIKNSLSEAKLLIWIKGALFSR